MHSYYFPGTVGPHFTYSFDRLHECVSFWSQKHFNYGRQMEKEASHENILMKTRAAVAAAGSEAQLRTIKTGAAIAQHLHRL